MTQSEVAGYMAHGIDAHGKVSGSSKTLKEAVRDGQGKRKKMSMQAISEFLMWYMIPLLTFRALDSFYLIYPDRNLSDIWPKDVSWGCMLTAALSDPLYQRRLVFISQALILMVPLAAWRSFVKKLFIPLATQSSGLVLGSLKCDKYLEQCWLALHYSISTILEFYALISIGKHWPPVVTRSTMSAFFMTEKQLIEEKGDSAIDMVYLLQTSFYSLELITLILSKNARRRSDAFVYAIHHLLTVFLLYMSFVFLSTEAGFLVLFFHDVGDVFLPIAKCFSYTEEHARAHYTRATLRMLEYAGVFFFICFLVSFAITRLVLFPMMLKTLLYDLFWYSRSIETPESGSMMEWSIAASKQLSPPICSARAYLMVGSSLLVPMHIYWFRLALRVAHRAVNGLYDDERSDDEEYSDDDKNKKEL